MLRRQDSDYIIVGVARTLLIHDILQCDAVQVFVDHAGEPLPDREYGAVSTLSAGSAVVQTIDGRERSLCQPHDLADSVILRRAGESVAAFGAADLLKIGMICSRYFFEIPCLPEISFRGM